MSSLDRLLSELEEAKRRFGGDAAKRVERLLEQLEKRRFDDAESLIRFHEALLFLRSHPQSEKVFERSEKLLATFIERVERLRASNVDFTPFDYIEYSGIAGTELSGTFSYGIARWLVEHYPSKVDVDWDRYEKKSRLAQALPRLAPLFYEDSLVEANIPYLKWIHAAKPRAASDLEWLIERFEQLNLSEKEKGELYDLLELRIKWRLGNSRASRTRNIRRGKNIFYHRDLLIRRSEVSLESEITSPLELQKLSPDEGERMIDMLRATTTVRYRELYGITHGDARSVVRADVGRGVEIFLWGLPPERRLPLRAYHAGFTLKNGVPINYIEGITICERMELGFNTFYTFRDGESAWVYAQALRVLHKKVGVTCFSIDPYQIGFNNEEAIESGAFWFYRKLGFRPTRPELARVVEREEKKIAADRDYRTPARVLRRLSTGHIIYELPGTSSGRWDRFEIRNLALRVQRRMSKEFDGSKQCIQDASSREVARALNVERERLTKLQQKAFDSLALVLALIPELHSWSDGEKKAAAQIIRAKVAADESQYAQLLQKHERLSDRIAKLGSQG